MVEHTSHATLDSCLDKAICASRSWLELQLERIEIAIKESQGQNTVLRVIAIEILLRLVSSESGHITTLQVRKQSSSMTLGQTNHFRLRKEGIMDQKVLELFSSLS
jgi:hypothetical protein